MGSIEKLYGISETTFKVHGGRCPHGNYRLHSQEAMEGNVVPPSTLVVADNLFGQLQAEIKGVRAMPFHPIRHRGVCIMPSAVQAELPSGESRIYSTKGVDTI